MLKTKTIAGALSLVALVSLLLSACSPTAASPTPDAQAIFTAAAKTVQAQLSQTAAAKPTNTVQPTATNTQAATPTLSTTLIAALPGPGTALPGTPGLPALPGISTPIPAVLPSATLVRLSAADKGEWVSQSPTDNTVVDPNYQFDMVWFVKNTGTTTWTKDYKLRYYVGDRFTDRNEFIFPESVSPGQTGRLVADATAPSTKGTYKTTFVLTNKDGVNFYVVDATIIVGSSSEATSVAGQTSTPNSLAWMCIDKDRSDIQGEGCQAWCDANTGVSPCYSLGVQVRP